MAARFPRERRTSWRKARWAVVLVTISIPLLIGPPSALAEDAPPGEVLDGPDEVDRLPEVPELDELLGATAPAPAPVEDPAPPEAAPVEDPAPLPAEDQQAAPAPDAAPPAADPATPEATDPAPMTEPLAGLSVPEDEAPADATALIEPVLRAEAEVPVVVTVNGAPIDGDEGHKIEGCAVVVGFTGLPADPEAPSSLGVTIDAIAPTMPEGSSFALVDDLRTTSDATFTAEYDMTDLLVGFEPKSNGYRLSVGVTVDGTSMGSKQLWLACGAAQTGHPNRIVFEVVWLDEDGEPFAAPLDSVMPAGWRDAYSVEASSIRGTATCTIPDGSEQLVCEYDNPGHGKKPGLVVPGGKKHTYDVAQYGLPEGWEVDGSTVGTFVGRETCGTGGGCGGHDDGGDEDEGGGCGGHDDAAALLAQAATESGGGGDACVHTIVNQYAPAPAAATTTTTTTTTTTAPPKVAPAAVTPTAPATAVLGSRVAQLPRTGTEVGGLTQIGITLVLAGAAIWITAAGYRAAVTTSTAKREGVTP